MIAKVKKIIRSSEVHQPRPRNAALLFARVATTVPMHQFRQLFLALLLGHHLGPVSVGLGPHELRVVFVFAGRQLFI